MDRPGRPGPPGDEATRAPGGPRQRTRAGVERLARQREELLARGEAEVPAVAAGVQAWRQNTHIGGNLVAGGLAFRLFVFLLPVVLLVHTTFGLAPASSTGSADRLADDLGLGAFAIDSIAAAASDATRGRVVLLGVALVAVAMTGSTLVRSVILTHQLAWGLPLRARVSPLAIAVAVAAVLALLGTNLVSSALRDAALPGRIAAVALSFAIYAGLWLVLSWRLPHAGGSLHALVPGALLVASGGLALHVATAFYLIGRAERAATTYGPLGVATVLLLWLFILARLIVAAALLNASVAQQERITRSG